MHPIPQRGTPVTIDKGKHCRGGAGAPPCPSLVDSHQQAVGVSLAHLEPSPEMDVRAWGGGIQVSASLSWEKGYPES